MKTGIASVDAYIEAMPEPARPLLRAIRAIIRKAAPDAQEGISYGLAGYKLQGRPLIYFGGFKSHVSLFPGTGRLVADLGDELAPFFVSKGTIRFPLGDPLPETLIERITKLRIAEVGAEIAAKKAKPKRGRA